MTDLSKRLERVVKKELSNNLIPVKTPEGILVGDVLISSEGSIKNLWRNGELIYKEVHLNAVTIKLANMLALRKSTIKSDELYRADQEYGKWFVDSQLLRNQYQKALNSQDFDRADMLWARYSESRDRTTQAKNIAESLARI
jgi:hypothetical protein